jgi:hypothetical protein
VAAGSRHENTSRQGNRASVPTAVGAESARNRN